jgi:quercetin dioxygenase-like cupin family protein
MNKEKIVNPVTGETLHILESNAQIFKFKYQLDPRGAIAGEHLHPAQQQTITVVAGELHCRVGDRPFIIRKGESVAVRAGIVHDQWNPTEKEVIAIEEYHPAGRIHQMFHILFALARDGKTDHKGVPYPLIGAAFVREFRVVIRSARFRHRLIFDGLGAISRLFGYGKIIRGYLNNFESRFELEKFN